MSTFADRLIAARVRAGLTQESLAVRVGMTQGQISKLERGARKTSTKTTAIALALGVDASWLGSDRGKAPGATTSTVQPGDQGASHEPLLSWEYADELPPGDFVAIPRMAVRLSAGAGHAQPEFELLKEKPYIVPSEWVRSMRWKPDALRVMYAQGNSMEPRIYEGDALIVDLSQTAVVDGKVFALYYDGGERVKRVSVRPGGGLIIASDNDKEHPVIALTADEANQVRIIGRIVNTSGHQGR